MSFARLVWRLVRGQRGQNLIMLAVLIPAFFALIAGIVDVGLLLGERTAAQKDVDAAALAGAQQLPEDPGGAVADAIEWADRNGVQQDEMPHAPFTDSTCYSDMPGDDPALIDSITVDAEAAAGMWMGRFFDVFSVNVGAHAKACVGSPQSISEGLRPFEVVIKDSPCFEDTDGDGERDSPLFGSICPLDYGAGDSTHGQFGLVNLGDEADDPCSWQGAVGKDISEKIIYGTPALCRKDDPVYTAPGNKVGPDTFKGIRDLLALEPVCDGADENKIDDFEEIFGQPPSDQPLDIICQGSPRFIYVIVVEEMQESHPNPEPLEYFGGFYILGCTIDGAPPDSHDERMCDPGGPWGQRTFWGMFVRTKAPPNSSGGPLDPGGLRVISLVE
ncbi:MAG: pilus assembly protein TadG-related protein [Dehalococcoidia bacterium]|nr:pilus assembly protein TadG-related protein [Dehalococcoidia bacterium]